MARLTTDAVLKEKQAADIDSVTAVSLTHKALSNVSCLGNFRNIERLDLGYNNLTSLEDLALCVNLKWLSVVENKLRSLKGVEALIKLTVLNAGKNKLRSMDEVKDLVNLHALILNDNEIASICNLDKLKDLNTLVLSRNPVRKMGGSFSRLKSLTKISLSYCELEGIDSSIKGCVELKELRLGHNEIKTLPAELAHASKLQNLDLGSNLIKSRSELEVLSSLQRLRNLNLQGNPVAGKDKLVTKILKLAPGLRIYNNKPFEKFTNHGNDSEPDSNSLIAVKVTEHNKMDKGSADAKMKSATIDISSTKSKNGSEHLGQKPLKTSAKHTDEKEMHEEDSAVAGKKLKSKTKNAEENAATFIDDKELKQERNIDRSKKKKLKESLMNESRDDDIDSAKDVQEKKLKKAKEHPKTEAPVHDAEKTTWKKSKRKSESVLDIIDNGDIPFSELLALEISDNLKSIDDEEKSVKGAQGKDAMNPVVITAKRRKTGNPGQITSTLQFISPAAEVGLGGPSAWGDE